MNTSPKSRALRLPLLLCLGGLIADSASAAESQAIITFSGLYNGVDAATDPELKSQGFITQLYQPLLRAHDGTKPIDGGALDVGIRWEKAMASSLKYNRGVVDHSGDYTLDGSPSKGGVMFSGQPYSMIFERPVEVACLYWTYYAKIAPGGEPGSISVYAKATDEIPLKTIKLIYAEERGYAWMEDKSFVGLAISKITFTPSVGTLNIDDITIVSTPR